MQIFHDYTFTFAWWQMGVFKIVLITLGILIGATWSGFFKKPAVCWTIFIIFLISAVYMLVISIPKF